MMRPFFLRACDQNPERAHYSRRGVLVLIACVACMAGSCTSLPDANSPHAVVDRPPGASQKTTEVESTVAPSDTVSNQPVAPPAPPPFSIEDRMSLGIASGQRLDDLAVPVFSFRADELPLDEALRLFSRANHLNIVLEPEIDGMVTVDFHDLALGEAMAALLNMHGYYWEKDGGVIFVRRLETRTFTLDYIRLERSGMGRNKAQVTSGSGGVGGQDAGEVTLSQEDHIKFWEEIETQLKALLSSEGRFVVNRLSGTIHVTDLHSRIEGIAAFLSNIRRSLYRQVEIRARIYEVALRDDYSLGLNWDRITLSNPSSSFKFTNIVSNPAGGVVARAATGVFSFDDGDFKGMLQALREQGNVKVVSQPRILTLNNQPALIKVGTDQSFFSSTVAQGTGGTGNIVTEQIRTVTSGLVLSVTPQISQDGWIIMDVSPIITRLTETVESPNGSTAPVLEVKQSGGLVRVRHGDMVIIGGLIQDQVTNTDRSVPVLSDIPWVGRLFQGTYQAERRTELVIFLMPRILNVT